MIRTSRWMRILVLLAYAAAGLVTPSTVICFEENGRAHVEFSADCETPGDSRHASDRDSRIPQLSGTEDCGACTDVPLENGSGVPRRSTAATFELPAVLAVSFVPKATTVSRSTSRAENFECALDAPPSLTAFTTLRLLV